MKINSNTPITDNNDLKMGSEWRTAVEGRPAK